VEGVEGMEALPQHLPVLHVHHPVSSPALPCPPPRSLPPQMSYFIVLHLSYFAQVFKPCARSVSVSELRNGCTPGAVLAYLLKAAAFAGLLIQHLLFCYRGGVLVSRWGGGAEGDGVGGGGGAGVGHIASLL
jgi:hypothetical protein